MEIKIRVTWVKGDGWLDGLAREKGCLGCLGKECVCAIVLPSDTSIRTNGIVRSETRSCTASILKSIYIGKKTIHPTKLDCKGNEGLCVVFQINEDVWLGKLVDFSLFRYFFLSANRATRSTLRESS